MTTAQKIHTAAYSVLFLAVVLFVAGWVKERIATEHAQAKADAQQQIVDTQKKIFDDAAAQIKKNDDDYREHLADLIEQFQKVKTPDQAYHYTRDAVGNLPAPIRQAKELPDAPSATPVPAGMKAVVVGQDDAIVPHESYLALAAKANKCQQDSLGMSNCEADKAELKKQLVASQATAAANQKKADDWKAAAKGGTKWQRLGKALKVVGCAAAGSAAGSLSKQRAAGAAVGAAGGAALCSIF